MKNKSSGITRLSYINILVLLFLVLTDPTSLYASEMKLVQGGEFERGTNIEDLEEIRIFLNLPSTRMLMEEVPRHKVSVTNFFIDQFDVTNEDYAEFVRLNPAWRKQSADPSLHNGRYLEHWGDAGPPNELLHHPVTFVTWFAAEAFCEWQGKRLPTEIEYEWAAQDGASDKIFPWGDDFPKNNLVNWSGDGIKGTVPVGSYPPNSRGLYDMSGNVWHYTSDLWLGSYSETLEADPDRLKVSHEPMTRRIIRGGSWGAHAANLRIRFRDSHRSFDARDFVGFRCAKSEQK